MSEQWSVPAWGLVSLVAAVLVLLAVVGLVSTRQRQARRRTDAELAAARADAEAIRAQVEAIERRLAAPTPLRTDDREYVITRLGEEQEPDVAPVPILPAPVFADLVLRESVVQAASLAAGLRRALAPEMRHRIRFEMRREVKRARKQRRLDVRQLRREHEARQRARVDAA